jgi:hypothetical protein
VLCWESSAPCLWCEFFTSVSATGHHDLLRDDELVVFRALLPRLDAAEPDCAFFAVVPVLLDEDLLGVDFWAVGRDLLDDDAPADDFFAGTFDAVVLDRLAFASDVPSLAEPRGGFCSER